MSIVDKKKALEALIREQCLEEPDRGDLSPDSNTKWRLGHPPDYTLANYAFLKEKAMCHKPGSVERIVEDLVKTWEMEASHKIELDQWTSVNQDHYVVQSNNGPVVKGSIVKEIGNYNALLGGCKAYQELNITTFDESHALFRGAFGEVFPWEVVEVKQGPPEVLFSWRHWGHFTGAYRDNQGQGQVIEFFGVARVLLVKEEQTDPTKTRFTDQWKIGKLQVFFDADAFVARLEGKPCEELSQEESLRQEWEKASKEWGINVPK